MESLTAGKKYDKNTKKYNITDVEFFYFGRL
jgi:hypothetical protein